MTPRRLIQGRIIEDAIAAGELKQVDFWDFSVFGKSITYLFSVPPGRSIPSLATICKHINQQLTDRLEILYRFCTSKFVKWPCY